MLHMMGMRPPLPGLTTTLADVGVADVFMFALLAALGVAMVVTVLRGVIALGQRVQERHEARLAARAADPPHWTEVLFKRFLIGLVLGVMAVVTIAAITGEPPHFNLIQLILSAFEAIGWWAAVAILIGAILFRVILSNLSD